MKTTAHISTAANVDLGIYLKYGVNRLNASRTSVPKIKMWMSNIFTKKLNLPTRVYAGKWSFNSTGIADG